MDWKCPKCGHRFLAADSHLPKGFVTATVICPECKGQMEVQPTHGLHWPQNRFTVKERP